MRDFRTREEQRGRRFRGMEEVAQAASDDWKNLTQAERDDYNDYAKEVRAGGGDERRNVPKKEKPLEKKYNSAGRCLADIQREAEERKKNEEEIQTFVKQLVRTRTGGMYS